MRAVIVEAGSVVVRERPDPVPGAGELLVRVQAAGLNRADLLQRAGLYPAPSGWPVDIPGLEFAGIVTAVGPGSERFVVGDRVMAVVGGGAQAELATVHERTALPVPDGLGFLEAGGFPEVFTVAHDALFTQCGLRPGERVLVNGAAGGVGVAGVQLALAAGATAVASVRAAQLRGALAAFGATAVDPADTAAHGPYDVVLEPIGAPNLSTDLDSLAVGGRIAIIGVGAGARGEIDLLQLMERRARIHGATLRARPLEDKAVAARLVERQVLPLLATGRVRVVVEEVYELADVGAAYERFAAGDKLGKIVLNLAG
ncbi:MAG: zinc-binding dehydrogenase [Acidimicrobiales bacterium]|jgi:NADPH:quinone reductase-like Zn-dependent oxidoreductase